MAKMTSKERLDAVINGEIPDRVPAFDISGIVAATWTGHLWKDVQFDPKLSAKITQKHLDRVKMDFSYGCIEPNALYMDLDLEIKYYENNYTNIKSHYFRDAEEIESRPLYDPYNRKECPKLWDALVGKGEELVRTYKGETVLAACCWGPFTAGGALRGVEEMMMDIALNPDLAKKAVDRGTELVYAVIDIGTDNGMQCWLGDPSASGDLIGGADYEEYVHRDVKKIVDMVHGKDKHCLMHICGNSSTIIDAVPKTGIDVFSLDFMVDIGEAKKHLNGKCALMGNINPISILMMKGVPEVKAEAERIMRSAAPGGGFILAPGCETPRDTPIENIVAIREAAEAYRY